MKVTFVTEARFIRNEKGVVYSIGGFPYSLWKRYLEVFSHINVLARVQKNESYRGINDDISSGPDVTFLEIPYYVGPMDYLKRYRAVKRSIRDHIYAHRDGAFICRVPGKVSFLSVEVLTKISKGFGLEVVGDPEDVFGKENFSFIIRTYFRKRMKHALQEAVYNAQAVLYVTQFTLQKKYPSNPNGFTTHASNVHLSDKFIQKTPKKWIAKAEYRLLSIGTLEQLYKAPEIVIAAIEIINGKQLSFSVSLTWLGEGKFMRHMLDMVSEKKLEDVIDFKGNVSKDDVFHTMNNTDLFLLASRTEGLPRVVIEAMAYGLPCVGTRVGGIPELLEEDALVPPNDAVALADKIIAVLSSENRYNTYATRNLNEAEHYSEAVLKERREAFYDHVMKLP